MSFKRGAFGTHVLVHIVILPPIEKPIHAFHYVVLASTLQQTGYSICPLVAGFVRSGGLSVSNITKKRVRAAYVHQLYFTPALFLRITNLTLPTRQVPPASPRRLNLPPSLGAAPSQRSTPWPAAEQVRPCFIWYTHKQPEASHTWTCVVIAVPCELLQLYGRECKNETLNGLPESCRLADSTQLLCAQRGGVVPEGDAPWSLGRKDRREKSKTGVMHRARETQSAQILLIIRGLLETAPLFRSLAIMYSFIELRTALRVL